MEQSGEVRGFLSSLIETFGTPRMGPAFTDAISAEPGVLGWGQTLRSGGTTLTIYSGPCRCRARNFRARLRR